jgi:hypothetical protein
LELVLVSPCAPLSPIAIVALRNNCEAD